MWCWGAAGGSREGAGLPACRRRSTGTLQDGRDASYIGREKEASALALFYFFIAILLSLTNLLL